MNGNAFLEVMSRRRRGDTSPPASAGRVTVDELLEAAKELVEANKKKAEADATATILQGIMGKREEVVAPPAGPKPNDIKETAEALGSLAKTLIDLANSRRSDAELREHLENIGKQLNELRNRVDASPEPQPPDTMTALRNLLSVFSELDGFFRERYARSSLQGEGGVAEKTGQDPESLRLQKEMLQTRLEYDLKLEEMRRKWDMALEEFRHRREMDTLQARAKVAENLKSAEKFQQFQDFLRKIQEDLGDVLLGSEGSHHAEGPVGMRCPSCGEEDGVIVIPGLHRPGDKVSCRKCGEAHEITDGS